MDDSTIGKGPRLRTPVSDSSASARQVDRRSFLRGSSVFAAAFGLSVVARARPAAAGEAEAAPEPEEEGEQKKPADPLASPKSRRTASSTTRKAAINAAAVRVQLQAGTDVGVRELRIQLRRVGISFQLSAISSQERPGCRKVARAFSLYAVPAVDSVRAPCARTAIRWPLSDRTSCDLRLRLERKPLKTRSERRVHRSAACPRRSAPRTPALNRFPASI